MMIAHILKSKGSHVTSVSPNDTVLEVARVLGQRRIGAVLVMDTADQVLGILSERDIVGRIAEHGAQTLAMTAAQLMTRDLKSAAPSTTVEQAMGMMTEGRFRHLPVVEDGQLIGLVSIGDVVKARISDQELEVDSLRAYVAGAA